MSDIDQLQQRLSAAMDRISTGVGVLGDGAEAAKSSAQTIDALKKNVEDARKTNTALQTRLSDLSQEADRLRQANEDLRDTIQALREAGEEKLGDPAKIDTAMASELESLRALQSTSEAEARAILDALAPLLAEKKEDA
jgi:chromosome segregation ATPase